LVSDETYRNPDKEIYASVLPGLTTLHQAGSMIIAVSSVYGRHGLLYEKIVKHHGQDDPNVLAILQPSKVYNPNLIEDPLLAEEIRQQLIDDPDRGLADWNSVWRQHLADFVSREASRITRPAVVWESSKRRSAPRCAAGKGGRCSSNLA
jgi:hypothetical protein